MELLCFLNVVTKGFLLIPSCFIKWIIHEKKDGGGLISFIKKKKNWAKYCGSIKELNHPNKIRNINNPSQSYKYHF